MFDNTVYRGDTFVGPCGSLDGEVHQTWISYMYYHLEMDLEQCDFVPNLKNKIIVADSWSPEYFLYLYNTVGRDYSWWYMNYLTDRELAEFLNTKGKQFVTLIDNHQPAGFAILNHNHGRQVTNLEYFGLLPHAIGKGLGKKFLQSCMVYASYASRSAWLYTTNLDHPNALPTYKKAGFIMTDSYSRNEYYPTYCLKSNKRLISNNKIKC